jgi:orotate phosphoribosyltransferase-like protein
MAVRWTEEMHVEILAARDRGLSTYDIADEIRVDRTTMIKHLKEEGITLKPVPRRKGWRREMRG